MRLAASRFTRVVLVVIAVSTAVICCAKTAFAESPEHASTDAIAPSGVRFAVRSGYALPIGSAFQASGSLSDTVSGYVPIRLDVGYRFRDHFYAGAVGQLAQIIPNQCPSGASCGGTDTRISFMLAAHLFPHRRLDPWLGVGMGFETYGVTRSIEGSKTTINAKGLELCNADLGIDYHPYRGLRVGPVLSTSIGQFTELSVNGVTTKDFQPQLHAWVLLGVRGAYDL